MTSTTNPVPPIKPTVPKFGDLVEISKDHFVAWTGGKPKADWTGLENPSPPSIDPNQYRVSSISSRAKSKAYRTKGLEKKFTCTSDLLVFQKKVWKHLVEYGLDTITYVPDPAASMNTTTGLPTKVMLVITGHSRYTVKA